MNMGLSGHPRFTKNVGSGYLNNLKSRDNQHWLSLTLDYKKENQGKGVQCNLGFRQQLSIQANW